MTRQLPYPTNADNTPTKDEKFRISLMTIVLAYPLNKDKNIVVKSPLIGRIRTLLMIVNMGTFEYNVQTQRKHMVEVFKTNVQEHAEAQKLVAVLRRHFPGNKINIDLDDCDKVLRVEGNNLPIEKLMTLVTQKGFVCTVLD